MTVAKKNGQLIVLLSGVVIVIPMVIFPARLGLDIGTGSFTYAIIEILWYGTVFFFMRSNASILQVFQGAGLTFLYRIIIGTVFGIFIAVMYQVNISAALSLGVSRYFPAILLHIVTAPFITKPLYLAIIGESRGQRPRFETSPNKKSSITDQPYFSKDTKKSSATDRVPTKRTSTAMVSKQNQESDLAESRPDMSLGQNVNGFDRAVRYICEDGLVKLAAVVDHEGLTVANFIRGNVELDRWAPLAELYKYENAQILKRNYNSSDLQRIDLFTDKERICILNIDGFSLMVVSDREDNDLLGVRLHRAVEMIRKYISERYGKILSASTEGKYVSSS